MRNGWRGLAWALLLATGVVAAALVIAVGVVRLPPIQRWVGARVAAFLPPGMQVERANITFVPPGLRLRNVALSAEGPTIPEVICEPSLRDALAGRLELGRVRIPAASLTIVRDATGFHGLQTTAAPLWAAAATASKAAAPNKAPAPEPVDYPTAWPAVRVDAAVLTLVDQTTPGGPRTLRLSNLRFNVGASADGSAAVALAGRFEPAGQISVRGMVTLPSPDAGGVPTFTATATGRGLDGETLLGYLAAVMAGGGTVHANGTVDGSMTVQGAFDGSATGDVSTSLASGSFVWDEVHIVAPSVASAHFTTSPQALTLSEGHLTIPQLDAARIEVADIDAQFSYGDGTLHLDAGQARAYGGTWTQTGTVTLGAPPRYDMNVQAEQLACTALLTAVTGRAPQYGCHTLSATATVRGAWSGAKTVARRAEGRGHIEMRGGTIPSASVIGAIWGALAPLVEASASGRDLGPPTVVDSLTQTFTLNAGSMRTNDLVLATADYTVTGTGSVGLDGALDLDAEIAMTPAGVGRLLTVAALPVPDSPGRLPSIPARISGTIGDPLIRPDVRQMPLAVVQTLLGGVRGAGSMLGNAAENGLRALERNVRDPW